MHKPLVLATAALLGSVALAAAQPSPPPAPPPPAADAAPAQPMGDGMRGDRMREHMRDGPGMMRGGDMRGGMGMMQHGARAARFRFERDGATVSIQCAENETTRACVDAAGVLIDKLAAQPTR